MNRRRFILGSIAAPAVILTPGLLMPVRPVLASKAAPASVVIADLGGHGFSVTISGSPVAAYNRTFETDVYGNPLTERLVEQARVLCLVKPSSEIAAGGLMSVAYSGLFITAPD